MKILSYQGSAAPGNIEANLQTIKQTAIAAQALNVDVIVFPELFVSGYNIGNQVKALAQPVDGEITQALASIARTYHLAVICGFPECEENLIFNSAIAINRDGKIVGHHRKVFLFGDQEKAIFTAGDKFEAFELNNVKCGMTICYDIEFPETIRDLAKQEAKIIFNPTANMQPYIEVPLTLARARALENGVVVVYTNLCGEENGLEYTGLSAIIGPNGTDIARAGSTPTMLVSTIEPELISAKNNPYSTQLGDLYSSSYYLRR